MTIMPRDEVQKLLDRIADIKADLDEFDGDTRGHTAALWDAKEKLEAAAPDLARSLLAAHDEIDRLRETIEYVLDGYGLNAPEFKRQPEDDEDDWIVEHLRAALAAQAPATQTGE